MGNYDNGSNNVAASCLNVRVLEVLNVELSSKESNAPVTRLLYFFI